MRQRVTMLLAIGAASSLIFATGCSCGDDDNPDAYVAPDADDTDADTTDAVPPDAAAMTTHTGQLTIADIALAGAPQYGHGMKTFLSFYPVVDETATKIYDDRDAVGAGCAAWVYDLATQTPPAKENHGSITITGTSGTFPAACVFMGADYVCPGASGVADNVTIASAGALGAFTFTDTDAAFVDADAGKYISIAATNGMDNYPWKGAFPVIAVMSATTIVIGNAAPAAQTLDVDPSPTNVLNGPGIGITSNPLNPASTWLLVAGAGPVPPAAPGASPPEAIGDDDEVVVTLDAPDGDPFEDFTTNPILAGDDFSLTTASLLTFVDVPVDGTAFTVECNDDVASHTGTGPQILKGTDDEMSIQHTGAFAGVRIGAEVTISAATTGANNGTYTIIDVPDANTITYEVASSAGVAEAFDTSTGYAIDDCGTATLTGVSMDFNDGHTTDLLATHMGTGPNITYTASDARFGGIPTLEIAHTGEMSPAYFGEILVVTGATSAANDATYSPIIAATNDSVFVVATTAKVTEGFAAGTTYMVLSPISGLPSLATATKAGVISCASLTSTAITVVAGAAQALEDVAPTVVQSTFVRSALDIKTNDDLTNRVNILAGHGFASFTVPD